MKNQPPPLLQNFSLKLDFGAYGESTDKEILARIQHLLAKDGVDLGNIQIKVLEGDVTLTGVVTNEQMIFIDQEIVRCGVRDIQNRLRSIPTITN